MAVWRCLASSFCSPLRWPASHLRGLRKLRGCGAKSDLPFWQVKAALRDLSDLIGGEWQSEAPCW